MLKHKIVSCNFCPVCKSLATLHQLFTQ